MKSTNYESEKRRNSVNILGFLKFERKSMTFKQQLTVMIIGMVFSLVVLIVLCMLQKYALPLVVPGIIKQTAAIIKCIKSRSP